MHPITGEFYVDETDLQLPGPLPLALRRNYSSQNLADNQFGTGWKLSIMPYLSVSTGGTNIYAADMDGAVLAYVQTATNTNVWMPTLAANPQLNNNTTAGVGRPGQPPARPARANSSMAPPPTTPSTARTAASACSR